MPRYDENGSDDTVPCPYCGKAVYEDAERCPSCENYLSEEDAPRPKPAWVVVTVFVCLLIVFLWILNG